MQIFEILLSEWLLEGFWFSVMPQGRDIYFCRRTSQKIISTKYHPFDVSTRLLSLFDLDTLGGGGEGSSKKSQKLHMLLVERRELESKTLNVEKANSS